MLDDAQLPDGFSLDNACVDRLRRYRTEQSGMLGVKAYHVFSDEVSKAAQNR